MTCIEAVIFDYVGTLVKCKSYTMETSRLKLHGALVNKGFDVAEDRFVDAYITAHEKYRKVRYEQLREVTNAIWVAEALSDLGFQVTPEDSRVKAALNVFFQDFIDSLELQEGAKKLIKRIQTTCKVGLITNFTYAPVIYKSLRHLGISTFFKAVVVSEENGWRKPSSHIFQDELKKLQVHANKTVYIGDSPIEDIEGAKKVGLKTVFVPSQFHSLKDLFDSRQKPDFIASDLNSVMDILAEINSKIDED